MKIYELERSTTVEDLGQAMYAMIADLYPLCRSITGAGFRATLARIAEHVPLTVHEVSSGTPVFDWTVPNEWNIRDAYVKNARGERVIDFRRSNLHVVSYSVPVHRRMPLDELKAHLWTLPDHPDWIPYRTSYYAESWGFCLSHHDFLALEDGEYEVCIDASLTPGSLTYGEYYIAGAQPDEILISCHCCHPSLCNDNLSGIAVATWLAKQLTGLDLRYSYRFLFIPGTIGSITWLCRNEAQVARIKHGLVLTCIGDPGNPTYKRSRRGDTEIDQAVAHVLTARGTAHELIDFFPYGYDERQYCSPGFNLPVGCLMRTPHGRFPEYHTSADDLALVRPASLADSFAICWSTMFLLEHNRHYLNQNPKCEPQLGKRGLYRAMGGQTEPVDQMALLWLLNFSDGEHSVLHIAQRSGLPFTSLKQAADLLVEHDLLCAAS